MHPGQAIENLQGYQKHVSTGFENAVGERLVTWLREKGHKDVERFCVSHEVRMRLQRTPSRYRGPPSSNACHLRG
jgi:hypothetical protein